MKIHKKTKEALAKRNIIPNFSEKKIIKVREQFFSYSDTFTKADLDDDKIYEIGYADDNEYSWEDSYLVVFAKYSRIETDQEFCTRLIKEYDKTRV
jgi:hypothetical protein